MRAPTAIQNIFLYAAAWWAFFCTFFGYIRVAVIKNIIKLLSCGRMIRGYKKYCCSNTKCDHIQYVTFSCNSRFCSTCGKKATDIWIQKQKAILPDCEWQHITFTIPSEYWGFFESHRDLLKEYASAAADVIQKLAKKRGITVGIFTAIHTFGHDLKWNPHVHLSVTMGGLSKSREEWKAIRFSKKAAMPMWKSRINKILRKAQREGHISPEKGLLDKQYNRYWHIHFCKPTSSPTHTIQYLGQYLKRPPVSMSKLTHYDGQSVTFDYMDRRTGRHKETTHTASDFIGRFTKHIPEENFRMIRYYGFLANRVRGELLPIVYNLLDQEVKPIKHLTWRGLMIGNFKRDPLKCILCGSTMSLVKVCFGYNQNELTGYHKELANRQMIPIPN
jgi:hypothetical protein